MKKVKKPIRWTWIPPVRAEQIQIKSAYARAAEDIATELHGLSNKLHLAGEHRHGTAADVAAGILEQIAEEILS